MSQNTNLQERYSSIVEAKLRATSVFAGLFNNYYEGTPKAGAVKVPVRTEATVGDYTISTGGSINDVSTTYQTIVLDNDKYVNELIDGYVAAAVPDGMVAERLDSAGFALADTIDTALEAACVAGGTATTDHATSLTAKNIYASMVDAIQALVALKVKKQEIWVAASPATIGLLVKSAEFIGAMKGTADMGSGFRGYINGVPVYESANVTSADYIVGNKAYCHFVDEWAVPVAVNDLADGKHIGASAVQGRKIYGFLISKATTVLYH